MKACWKCGWEWEASKAPGFNETCPECLAYLHSCRNCRWHRPESHNDCASETSEWVQDKENHNYCEEFEFAERAAAGSEKDQRAKTQQARERFRKLFGDAPGKGQSDTSSDAKEKLKKLFQK